MSGLLVLQLCCGAAAATSGWRSDVKYGNWDRPHDQPMPPFPPDADLSKMRRQVINIERNMMCFMYNFTNFDGYVFVPDQNPGVAVFQPSIVDDDTESLSFFTEVKNDLEEKYGKRFSHELHPDETSPFEDRMEDFMSALGRRFFKSKGLDPYKSNVFDYTNASTAAEVFTEYFVDQNRAREAAGRTTELHKRATRAWCHVRRTSSNSYKHGSTSADHRNYQNYETEDLEKEVAQIEEIYSLLLAYIFNGHSYNFRDLHTRFGELKKYGTLAPFRQDIQRVYGDILQKQKEKEGFYPTEAVSNLIEELFSMEKKIRDHWSDVVAKLKGTTDPERVKRSDEQIRGRLRFFRMFTSPNEILAVKMRIREILALTCSSLSSYIKSKDSINTSNNGTLSKRKNKFLPMIKLLSEKPYWSFD